MLKSYNFWIRLVAVIILLLRVILSEFGISIDSGLIMDIATAVAGVLVVLGVIQVPATSVDNKNIGGGFMGNLNLIKQDIISAKEKLEQITDVDDKTVEVKNILESVIGYIAADEEVQEEPENKTENILLEKADEQVQEVSIIAENEEKDEPMQEGIQVGDAKPETIESGSISADLSEEELTKLKAILKEKLQEILTQDGDQIIEQILI